MGKKMKKKGPNPRKALHRVPTGSPMSVLDQKVDVGDEGEKLNGEACNHYTKSIDDLNRILLRIQSTSTDVVACEHCREEPVNKRGNKEKGKHPKKKGGGGGAKVSVGRKESNSTWVCLDCGRYFCGGEVSVSEPYGHARRHSKQEHHSWAVRSDDPLVSWCYLCNSMVPIEMPPEEVNGVLKPAMEQENGVEPLALESSKGYVVRGLANLGNTCFFNSVMQNLFAMDMLRDYLLSLDRPLGPTTMTLRKLFVETCLMVDSKSVLTPKALFGSICAKAPQFRGYQQQDSHELLRYLLDGLCVEEMNARKSIDSSNEQEKADSTSGVTFVDTIFAGLISSTVCCVECGHTSVVQEPFLDLSLPVPMKKSPSKKAPPPPPKRSKPPLKERNKGRRVREKVTVKGYSVTEHGKEESSEAPSECSESVIPAAKHVQDTALEVEDNTTWMDFLDDLGPEKCEEIHQSEDSAQCTSDSQLVDYSKDLVVSSDACGESSCQNEVASSSCVQDSGVLLLPYKEQDPSVEEINDMASCSQNQEDPSTSDAQVKTSSVQEEGHAVVDFDGFGDLFNEPEVSSVPKAENGMGEDMDATLWTGNSSESNQDEVDNTNAPVSINSCLALFTKPELLSDEQAWHCERCSKNVGRSEGNLKAVAKLDEGGSSSKKSSSDLAIGNGNIKRLDDPSAKENTCEKPFNLVRGSESNGEIQNDWSSKLQDPDGPLKDEDMAESDHTSQDLSCSSVHEKSLAHDILINQESGSCSIDDPDHAECDGPTVTATSSSHREDDNISEVNQLGEKGMPLLDKGQPVDRNGSKEVETEGKKVMRDATKRILISKVPPILTIHLKRFSQDARGRLTKLNGHVSFQETLDLRPYMDPRCAEKERCRYRLIGVVEHSGRMSGGHYIAYVRGERGRGKSQKGGVGGGPAWFYASDAHVRETSLSEVLNSEAYILFYERV